MSAFVLAAALAAPAYRFDPEIDLPVTALAAVIASGWVLRHDLAPAWCAPRCDASGVNAIDRGTAGRWDKTWTAASDITVATVLTGMLASPFIDQGGSGAGDFVIVGQSILLANVSAIVSNLGTRRPRPFMYGERAPLEEREDGNGSLSFFSGHTAGAFSAVGAAFGALHRRHPHSAAPWIVLGVGGAASAFIGVGRVLGGQHFPTDVLAGAVAGTALGILVPALHDKPVRVTPATDGSIGLRVFAIL